MPDPLLRTGDEIGQPAVQCLPTHGAGDLPGCRGQQRVPGAGTARLGQDDEPVADRALDRLEPGQGHEVCAGQLAVDGDGQEHGALVLGQVPDPEAQDVAHLSGHPERLPGRRDPAELQGAPDLEHEQRVAA